MTFVAQNARPMIVGKPVLINVDVQKGAFMDWAVSDRLPLLPDRMERIRRIRTVVDAARDSGIPIIFFKEVHRANMIDFGRELDGTEAVHCLETSPRTDFAYEEMGIQPDDYLLTKRRYSCFYGTELEILLKSLKADTIILTGGFTDVCVHYTFVDAHQGDYYVRVVDDCVSGSSQPAHDGALRAMEYLQTGACRKAEEIIAEFSAYAVAQKAELAAE